MDCFSIKTKSQRVSIRQAVLSGSAPDGGLYMPANIPKLDASFLDNLQEGNLPWIAFHALNPYFVPEIPAQTFKAICEQTFTFPAPVEHMHETLAVQELFHGPSKAFKDFGARFLARVLAEFKESSKDKHLILVATSGDTGAAVANGFYKMAGIDVVILFPSGRISPVQEKMLLSFDDNIHSWAVDGSFDDCQQLVKRAFKDEDLSANFSLNSANSINLARLLAQIVYYVDAFRQWPKKDKCRVVSVPSGNLGNLTAGVIAQQMGVPIDGFLVACNQNDVLPNALDQGFYRPGPGVSTLANAMDVGDPSNFPRLFALHGSTWNNLKKNMKGYSFTDEQILAAISEAFNKHDYLLDPHGAVGYLAATKYLNDYPEWECLFLATASPAKFPETIEKALGENVDMPSISIEPKVEKVDTLPAAFSAFKSRLLEMLD